MPTIPNFPKDLLTEHMNWHHARHNVDLDQPPVGYGLEFLRFHRDYISRALAWYNRNGNDPSLVEPWASVPEPIRQSGCYDLRAEARILYEPQSFASADELGRFIEGSGLHGCIHQEAAKLYGEPDINDFDVATRNTVFYNIHGMIDRWYRTWEGLGQFRNGVSHWCGRFEGDREQVLYYETNQGCWWLGNYKEQEAGRNPDGWASGEISWASVGDSSSYGPMNDGRAFRIWDVDGDGRLEVLFQHPLSGYWIAGKVNNGRLVWQAISG